MKFGYEEDDLVNERKWVWPVVSVYYQTKYNVKQGIKKLVIRKDG